MTNRSAGISAFSVTRWFFILLFFAVTMITAFWQDELINTLSPALSTLTLFIAVWLHGTVRYGTKNLMVFLLITWIVSNFFEALSIQTGFPFGHYYYDKLIGPRLFQVPLIIMFAYFATGYASWILANILLGQYNRKVAGPHIFLVPFIASFIMVMWDLCMDPLCSTIASLWVWRDGGSYFGVPLQNYFGWFLVVYIIYQCFAFYNSRDDLSQAGKEHVFSSKLYWTEIIVIYAIQGLWQIVAFLAAGDRLDIYGSMALVTIFTMFFVALLSYVKVKETLHLK